MQDRIHSKLDKYCGIVGGAMSIIYEHRDASIYAVRASGLTVLPHFHSHVELVYMLEGQSLARADYREILLEKGDLFIAFPNQIHGFKDLGPVSCYLLIFPGDLCPDFTALLQSHLPESPILKRHQRSDDNILPAIQALCLGQHAGQPYGDAIAKGYFTILLGSLLGQMTLKKVASDNMDTVRRIFRYCHDHYQQDLSLDMLESELNISKYHISHLFNQKLKISFTDFIRSLRIDDACNRLKQTDSTVTQIAFQVGYNSIRSFNRAFLQQTGMSPRQYRRQYRQTRQSQQSG